MANKGDVRIYLLDKSAFLSCGSSYITDTKNGILLMDSDYNKNDTLDLQFRTKSFRDPPYTLAPYPLEAHDWEAIICDGVKVYPSCDVDAFAESPNENEVPTVVGMKTVSLGELESYVNEYSASAASYRIKLGAALKGVDEKYRERLETIEGKINDEKTELRRIHVVPDFLSLIKG